jgi:HEAT repeat protein
MRAVEQREVDDALAAYEDHREREGPDGELLAKVARTVLAEQALSGDASRRDAALAQLKGAGTAGEPVLEELAEQRDEPVVRAKALEALARRDRGDARHALRRLLDHDHPAVLASAITAARPKAELDRLLGWLEHTAGAVRRAAALRLSGAVPAHEARLALQQAARVDPLTSVRSAACRALGAYGAEAVEALRGRLGDPESRVRLAAVRSLVRADRERGVEIVATLLGTQPSPAGVEAARVLVQTADDASPSGAVADARGYLRGVLGSGSPRLRAQAAIALSALPPDPALDRALVRALKQEKVARVRLQLARALQRRDAKSAQVVDPLEELMKGDGMAAIQAASMLAKRGHEGAIERLRKGLSSEGDSSLRRVAARALAVDAGRPDTVRSALQDEDPMVRIHAAGGILASPG